MRVKVSNDPDFDKKEQEKKIMSQKIEAQNRKRREEEKQQRINDSLDNIQRAFDSKRFIPSIWQLFGKKKVIVCTSYLNEEEKNLLEGILFQKYSDWKISFVSHNSADDYPCFTTDIIIIANKEYFS